MKTLFLSFSAVVFLSFLLIEQGIAQGKTENKVTIKGWLSDEECARGRAKSGTYTGTNPDCAKRCVAEGKKIVLIVPSDKVILNIENQEIASKNIGDYVEVTGNIQEQAKKKTLHIDSLKLLSEGRAVCDVPKSSK